MQRLAVMARGAGYDVAVADLARKQRTSHDGIDVFSIVGPKGLLSLARSIFTADVLHVHSAGAHQTLKELILALLGRAAGARCIFTIHGGGFARRLGSLTYGHKLLFRLLMKSIHAAIVVNPAQREAIEARIGASPAEGIHVVPAYIPPAASLAAAAKSASPVQLLASGGWQPVYGFDVLLQALSLLPEGIADWRLCLVQYSVEREDPALQSASWERARAAGIMHRITVRGPASDPTDLYRAAHVYVRPSRMDGDSVMVREALDSGLYVIASDSVERPEGVQTFRSEDAAGLAQVLGHVMKIVSEGTLPTPPASSRRFGDIVVALYGGAPDDPARPWASKP